jgi:UDP-hydrolysing UDP-N-acetyl-D-glucosamine 2-epimerase
VKTIYVFIGSRANLGRLTSLVNRLKADKDINVKLITGSYNVKAFPPEDVEFSIDGLLYHDTDNNMAQTVAIMTSNLSNYLSQHRPDAAIVHADRYENLAFAIACSYNNIPLIHTEGGEVSGNIDNKVRNAISSLADYHLVATERAKHRLSKMYTNVYNVGSPAIDYVTSIEAGLEYPLCLTHFILVLYHPCKEDDYIEFIEAVKELSKIDKIVWINPNADPGNIALLRKIRRLKNIDFLVNLQPEVYYNYLYNCTLLLGNTSSGIKEGGYLGVPYVLVGDRQKHREVAANVIRVGCHKDMITKTVNTISVGRFKKTVMFGSGKASEKMHKIIKGILND